MTNKQKVRRKHPEAFATRFVASRKWAIFARWPRERQLSKGCATAKGAWANAVSKGGREG